jgi:alpha-beta hydrolase superfamily lysophospholipase
LDADVAAPEGDVSSADGTRLHWREWPVSSADIVVAVVHGLGEHSGRYGALAAALNAAGIGCFAFDLRGMGSSGGRRGHVGRWQRWVEDLAVAHRLVVERAPRAAVIPLGHSFGGVLLASAVLRRAIAPSRFVLSNPAFRPAVVVPGWKLALGRLTSGLVPTLTLGNEVDPALLSRDPAVAAAYSADPLVHDRISSRLFTEWVAASKEALRRADEIDVPFRLILSEDDRIIDHRGGLEFARAAGDLASVRVYPDRYHEPFNDLGADEVFADLVSWLRGGT